MASSSRRTGSERVSSWTAKVTWPRRLPKSVPVTLRPRDGVRERERLRLGIVSHLQVGRVGKVMTWRRERRREEKREWIDGEEEV